MKFKTYKGLLRRSIGVKSNMDKKRFDKRYMAFILDMLSMLLVFWGVVHICDYIFPDYLNIFFDILDKYEGYEVIIVSFLYFVLFEWIFSTTIGKCVCKLRVVSKTIKKPNLIQIIIRNAFKVLNVVFFLDCIFMVFDKDSRRLGDLVAGTKVVEFDNNKI